MSSLSQQYLVGVKRTVINALRKVYLSPSFPDSQLAQKINIELEYPTIQERYPAVYVAYNERGIHDSGLGSFTLEADKTGTVYLFRQWIFEGDVIFNVMALDPLERDEISASLADLFAFGKDLPEFQPFYEEIYDEEFVSLQLLTSSLIPGGKNVTPAPWGNSDEFVYINSYGATAVGSFFTEPGNNQLIQINQVTPYPYQAGSPVPTGSTLAQDKDLPFLPMGNA